MSILNEEKIKDMEYAKNPKYYQMMQARQDRMDLANVINEFVKPRDSVHLEASKYGLDDKFMSCLLEQMDDIDFIYEKNRPINSRVSDVELLDRDSKINYRKHGMFLSRNNDNGLELMLIDGSNNKYSYIFIKAINPKNDIEVRISQYENGEVFRCMYNVHPDNHVYNSFCSFMSKDKIKEIPNLREPFSIEDIIPYMIEKVTTYSETIDRPASIKYDNGLMIAALLFNNGIRRYVVSKKDAKGEAYLGFDDEKIEQDLLEMVVKRKER